MGCPSFLVHLHYGLLILRLTFRNVKPTLKLSNMAGFDLEAP